MSGHTGTCYARLVQWVVLILILFASGILRGEELVPRRVIEARSPCAVHHPSDERIAWQCRRLQRGETLERLFGRRWIDVARFNRIDRRHAQPGREIKIPTRIEDVAEFTPMPPRYPVGEQEPQLIVVDLREQFLGAYERGTLRFSLPIASGEPDNETPVGDYRITAAHRTHRSCLYAIEATNIPYPMQYALQFYVNAQGVSYWIHGRDLPGYPASHGCIGLADERMQRRYYGEPADPVLDDAKRLYDWVIGDRTDSGTLLPILEGPRVVILGSLSDGGQGSRSIP
ncbi:MAG: L,D-transpeptidase [Nitrospira sp.]|uniref:ErfK/YbiS/YcfS/YnhG family protein n=1 Tax=Nitrospira defluvii TaxID=330214 RepID=A0ABM8RKK2_9BACT|nr:L,D-transpeptidase [Nitrospira defluvii]MCS6329351.1 L,D-transpeptidase [Nitrospira sp.]CAE6758263.1 ErfK/YbiS/YcfS/YnhG family protein [Nitrospira defluvii]